MLNLNTPAIAPGPLTAADLAEARRRSAGRVLYLHRAVIAGRDTCTGQCETRNGCDCSPDTVPTDYSAPGWLDSCAPEGGKHAGPVPSAALSMRRHGHTRRRVALVLLLALAGYAAHIAWPLLGN